MSKKVLVIPNDDNELNDFIEEIWDRTNKDTARDFIRSKALPGHLLASFKATIGDERLSQLMEGKTRYLPIFKEDCVTRNPVSMETEAIFCGKKYRVLILGAPACPDKGGKEEVKT